MSCPEDACTKWQTTFGGFPFSSHQRHNRGHTPKPHPAAPWRPFVLCRVHRPHAPSPGKKMTGYNKDFFLANQCLRGGLPRLLVVCHITIACTFFPFSLATTRRKKNGHNGPE
ncbi:hypothetical protein TW95_gp0383 [Pandoravirus inopinatum]|uniref:Uncharacterized protein n=1 Tax=Pandoravirus inopinatum TaxID=1605721 RepID=A0A0B5JC07_9VIRU|nr:hypothetical protein TW95_gp0383 [Pandoravirus inopinatum]AJF97117.1 hypothetical protein [Pandoravirus inopinatum]